MEDDDEQQQAAFARDPILSQFLSEDLNATSFASEALRSGSAGATASKLQDGIQMLDRQLRHEVIRRHSELFQLLVSVKDAESSLEQVRSGARNLQSSELRVRSELADPYKSIGSKSVQLSHVHDTVCLLRAVVRLLRQLRRLRELFNMKSSPDLPKAAQLLSEIEQLRNEFNLTGVGLVEDQLPWLKEAGGNIRNDAMRALRAGLEALNQAEVGSSLQVYYNLGELRPTVWEVVQNYAERATKSISTALDLKAITSSHLQQAGVQIQQQMQQQQQGPGGAFRSGMPQLGAGSRAQSGLWQRLGLCLEELQQIMVAVWHLQRVMSKQRDPVTHVVFLDELVQPGEVLPTVRVWQAVVNEFSRQIKSAFTGSSFVKEMLVLGYPRLLGLLDSSLSRLVRDTDVKGVPPAIRQPERDQLIATVDPFQKAYLGHVLSRLTDLVNGMFVVRAGVPSTPSQEQVSKLASRIREELEAAKSDASLALSVVKEIYKAVRLFAEKCECQIATGPDARQVTGSATPAQSRNIDICTRLQEFNQQVSSSRVVASLPANAAEILSQAIKAANQVAVEAMTPLFKSVEDRLEKCIVQMHEQEFGKETIAGDETDSSSYMEGVQEACSQLRSQCGGKLGVLWLNLARDLASRLVLLFVRHAALVRPLSEGGKLRLARDMAELELLVGQSLVPLEQLESSYRALRALRRLIFTETGAIEGDSGLLQDLPKSAVLHHLYSRAPDELESPMSRSKLKPGQYSLWLDAHAQDEQAAVCKEVKTTLEDYATAVKSRGDTHFCTVYPLMLRLASQ